LKDNFYQISNLKDKKRIFNETSFKSKVIEINGYRNKLLEVKDNTYKNTESNVGEKKKPISKLKSQMLQKSFSKSPKQHKFKKSPVNLFENTTNKRNHGKSLSNHNSFLFFKWM